MSDTTISRRSAIAILGGTLVAVAVATLPAVPALADAAPEPSTWRETLAAARAVELSPSQRARVVPVALEMHRAIMDSMVDGPTGRDLSRVAAVADRLLADDRDVARAAFTLVQGIYEYAV